ncbi:hypothetical protein ACH4UM_18815 [Streptomyces sp. NPDC020801]|uniref:hypothetical protein n=1 Tax=Streptomyces sp. NPDC020801 TaxID=3365093 RepID=UPI00379DA8DF
MNLALALLGSFAAGATIGRGLLTRRHAALLRNHYDFYGADLIDSRHQDQP